MKLEDANNLFGHRVVGGSDYGWRCWPNARYMDYESEHAWASVVFSTGNGMIFEATVTHKNSDKIGPYRWLNPAWKSRYDAECQERSVGSQDAWDKVQWVDLEVWDDFAQKAGAIFRGESFDTRIQVPVDLSDSEFMHIARMAHERDITFNQMVARIIEKEIEVRSENETKE